MEFVAILIILLLVVFFVSAPLRGAGADTPAAEQAQITQHESEIAELEAAREAKYREIRDADLDHRTGKLSDADYAELDAGLRAEAIAILDGLDKAASGAESHAESGAA
jgi:cell division protein FtsB